VDYFAARMASTRCRFGLGQPVGIAGQRLIVGQPLVEQLFEHGIARQTPPRGGIGLLSFGGRPFDASPFNGREAKLDRTDAGGRTCRTREHQRESQQGGWPLAQRHPDGSRGATV